MRGRLLFPFLAELAQLDRAASRFDPDFKEPLPDGRAERPVTLPCQVEVAEFETLEEAFSGDLPKTALTLVFHFRDLERLGLIEPETGEPRLRVGDRLAALRDRAGKLVQAIRMPPGLFIVELRPVTFGFGLSRNLLLAVFHDREQGVRS
ncbi:MAG: hypothetical protein ACYCWW_00930 [Deltaproteobacteria bacterium]